MPFCQDCGALLNAGSKFCTDCGAPVLDVPGSGPNVLAAGESAQGAGGEEKVIAVIPNLMKVRGLFLKGPSWHHLVVTSGRIIVVQKTVKGLERMKQDIGVIGPDPGYFFLKAMKPDQILAENPESQVIPLTELMTVTVSKFVSYSTEDGSEPYWQVFLTTKKEALKLRTDYHDDPGEYFRNPALTQVLGKRLVLQDI
jgi:hypothetical protein